MTILCQRHVSKKALAHTPWVCGKQFKKPSSKINKLDLTLNSKLSSSLHCLPLWSQHCIEQMLIRRHHTHTYLKKRVALEGILGRLPAEPYAYSGLHSKWQISPFFMVATPMSHALITWPRRKEKVVESYRLYFKASTKQKFKHISHSLNYILLS